MSIGEVCTDYKKQTYDGCKNVKVETPITVTKSFNQIGTCQNLIDTNVAYLDCSDRMVAYDNNISGCESVVIGSQEVGFTTTPFEEKGTCEARSDIEKNRWSECSNISRAESVYVGKKQQEYSCNKYGGSTCADYATFFVPGSCQKVRDAGYNASTFASKTIENPVELSCLEVTGVESCQALWKGSKTITKTESCSLVTKKPNTHFKFSVDGADGQSLARSVAHKLQTGFTKSVYVSVAHDLDLNLLAFEKAKVEKLAPPSIMCGDYYLARREEYKGQIDGVQFNEVVKLLGSQGTAYSICSPERYSSEQLDYLVGDAQLDFEVAEYEKYDLLEIAQVKFIYASGDSKVLAALDFTYKEGHVTLINPLLAKNLVEAQMSYKGFEK